MTRSEGRYARVVMARIVDLTHPIGHGTITYPGLPGPELSDHLSREASRERYAPGTEFHIGRITMVGNTGTYLDTPFHRYPDGTDLATTPLERMDALRAGIIDYLTAHPGRDENRMHVHYQRFIDGGIEMEVSAHLEAKTTEAEKQAREALVREVLRLARSLDVEITLPDH